MNSITSWLNENQLLVTLILTPILSLIVAAVSAWYSTKRALSAERLARRHQSILEISKFRQEWINSLRNDLAQFNGLALFDKSDEQWHQMAMLISRIKLRMNPNDEDYNDFSRVIANVIDRAGKSEAEKAIEIEGKYHNAGDDLIEIGQRILKREWERLKSDLESLYN